MRLLFILLLLCYSNLGISAAKASGKDLSYLTLIRKTPLSECLCREFPLSVREKFHSQIIKDIVQRFNTKKNSTKPLVITSYSSGKLLREYLIVRELNRNGFKNIILNAIDPIYLKMENQSIFDFLNLIGEDYLRAEYFFNVDYYRELVQEVSAPEVMTSDVILDIDSNCFQSTKDFDFLVSQLMNENGRSYSLRVEMHPTSMRPMHTGFMLNRNLLATTIPGFNETQVYKSNFESDLSKLPPNVKHLILSFLRP